MKRIGAVCLWIGTLALGCGQREYNGQPAMTPAARTSNNNERSILAITEQRCQREMKCNNVGADKSYSSLDECRQRLNAKGYDSLNSDRCPSGIDQTALNSCLNSIQAEDCSNPIDSLERFVDCRAGKLCSD